MTEHQRQTEFLKELMQSQDCAGTFGSQCRELQTRIWQAERDERCICSAINIAIALALLSLLGLGYSAVLAADAGADSSITTLKVFSVTLLASLICLVGFVGFWYSSRSVTNGLYHECRAFIRASQRSQPASPPPRRAVNVATVLAQADSLTTSETQVPRSSEPPKALEAAESVPVLVR